MTAQERALLGEYARRVVDGFPPLTDAQRGRLAALLTGTTDRGEADGRAP